ncbi:3-hydroxyacyl-CoA dehydrogenase family protein [Mucilaginibacter sp.]|uniref:3-hydroxyacyl-CoA dehydrogenase family protein n=1 Tax=Mucilaginibacter sp. TaxID=1882438 RepID=UPI003B00B51E
MPLPEQLNPAEINVGVVGLGLMGSSIAVALLIAGHPVKAIAPLPEELAEAPTRILEQLLHCEKAGLLKNPLGYYLDQLTVSADYNNLENCILVLECVTEQAEIKKEVYTKIAAAVADDTIIASNTSAIPISILQNFVPHPQRFLGIHWAEPAFMTRFLEITCGEQTDINFANRAFDLAHYWGKEPTLLKKDIRGFVTNRLMYAVYREGLNLADQGIATIEDMDKAFRYDAGSWMTLMGIFRRLDYLGLEDMETLLQNILPQLNNTDSVPKTMQKMIDLKAKGTQNSHGFYNYKDDEAKEWEAAFAEFNKDIDRLAALYPSQNNTHKNS